MENNDDSKFDQFLRDKMQQPKAAPSDEWINIHRSLSPLSQSVDVLSWFKRFWPVTTALAFSFGIMFYNYKIHQVSEVDRLMSISFSDESSWDSSVTLVSLSQNENN